eukprot:4127393-Prymnesium_polylepis.1
MSHAVLWSRLAARPDDSPPLLVLEDDVVFKKGFADGVARIVQTVEQSMAPSRRTVLAYLGADVAEWTPSAPAIPVGNRVRLRSARYLWCTH